MIKLRSFSYTEQIPKEVYELFGYLVEHPEHKCDVCYEIIEAAMQGRVSPKDFNLLGYEYTVKKNEMLKKSKTAKFIQSLDDGIDENASIISGNTSSRKYIDTIVLDDKLMTKFEEDESYNYSINWLISNIDRMFKEFSLDIILCLRNSLIRIPGALDELKELFEVFPEARENIIYLLEHGLDDEFKNYMEVYCNGDCKGF